MRKANYHQIMRGWLEIARDAYTYVRLRIKGHPVCRISNF